MEAPRGHLRISASVTIGQHLLAPYVSEFIQNYPEIELEIELTNRRVDVIAEGYDLVVRVGNLEDSTLISRRLGTGYAMLFTSPKYLKRAGSPRRMSDLEKHGLLLMTESPNLSTLTLLGPKDREQSVSVTPITIANDLTLIRQITVDGGGISLLPDYLGKPLEKTKKLLRILPSWRTPPFHYYALYPSRRGITLKTRVLLEFLASKLA